MALMLVFIAISGCKTASENQPPAECVYQGKTVSAWMNDFSSKGGNHSDAEKAFRAMGRAAIPYIISELTLADAAGLLTEPPVHERWRRAIRACMALQREAEDASDALAQHLEHDRPDNNLCMALGSIGTRGIMPLTAALEHEDPGVQEAATFALQFYSGHLYHAETHAFLTNCLRDADFAVRSRAAFAFGVIGDSDYKNRGEAAVSALLRQLNDPNDEVRAWVIFGLSGFGESPEAVAAVERAAIDRSVEVRFSATNAMERIAALRKQR
jgi:HEAT repeat protein